VRAGRQGGRARLLTEKGWFDSSARSHKGFYMKILLLLGKNDEYLDNKRFETDEELDSFLESITPLMMANISGEMTLRKRLKLLPNDVGYFLYAGAVQGFEVIDLDETE
jgi:hypothetical protein